MSNQYTPQQGCETISQLWRKSGKQMPFKQFVDMFNKNQLDAYYGQQNIPKKGEQNIAKKPKANPITANTKVCSKKGSNSSLSTLQVAALVVILVGTIYLVTSKKD